MELAMTLLVFLIIGAIAGWLAGLIVKGGGFGLIGDIVSASSAPSSPASSCRASASRLAAA